MLACRPRPARTHKAKPQTNARGHVLKRSLLDILLLRERAALPLAVLQPLQLQNVFPRCEGSGSSITNTTKQQPETAFELPWIRTARRLAGWWPSADARHHLPPPYTRRQHNGCFFGSHQHSSDRTRVAHRVVLYLRFYILYIHTTCLVIMASYLYIGEMLSYEDRD